MAFNRNFENLEKAELAIDKAIAISFYFYKLRQIKIINNEKHTPSSIQTSKIQESRRQIGNDDNDDDDDDDAMMVMTLMMRL